MPKKHKLEGLRTVERRDVYDYNGEYYCYIEGTPEVFQEKIVINGAICKWDPDKNAYVSTVKEMR